MNLLCAIRVDHDNIQSIQIPRTFTHIHPLTNFPDLRSQQCTPHAWLPGLHGREIPSCCVNNRVSLIHYSTAIITVQRCYRNPTRHLDRHIITTLHLFHPSTAPITTVTFVIITSCSGAPVAPDHSAPRHVDRHNFNRIDYSFIRSWYRGRIQLLLKRLPDSSVFHNLSWLMSGRTSGHQNLVSIFPGINNCLKAKRQRLVVYLMLLGTSRPHLWLILEEVDIKMMMMIVHGHPILASFKQALQQ